METVIAGLSAFQYHRIPPRILQALDEPLDISTLSGRIGLGHREKYLLYLETPLDTLVRSRSECHRSRGMNRILWEGSLPPGAIWEIDSYLKVTSPAFTLFLLASRMNRYRLAMAMYELCGSFTVFKTLPQHFDLARTLAQLPKRLSDGWRPVVDERGNITELWRRPPLVTVEELCSMAEQVHGRKGYRVFTRTIDEIRGVAASPLEARAAMRLCGSRLYGGEGFGPVELNRRVAFSRAARAVTDGSRGFVDFFFRGGWAPRGFRAGVPGKNRARPRGGDRSGCEQVARLADHGYRYGAVDP